MAYGHTNMAYEHPPFMPYEPFLLGVGVVFNLVRVLWRRRVGASLSHVFVFLFWGGASPDHTADIWSDWPAMCVGLCVVI